MKVRKRGIFEAEQWFPGKEVPGVTGTDPKKWCGCVIAGGPPDIPHIHPSVIECELIKVVTDAKGKRCLVKPDIDNSNMLSFDKIYEKV